MKNNHNIKYVLMALVILIWGGIIYKVINGLHSEDVILPRTAQKVIIPKIEDSTYQLLSAEYPDPFTNQPEQEEEDTVEAKPPVVDPLVTQGQAYAPLPVQVERPISIKYNGYIYNPATKKKTALITYDGRTMVVGIADMLDEKTKVLQINYQELVISSNGKRKIVGVD